MFGYIRPESNELLVREFNIFKAVYCGICKKIKEDYGNVPRVTLSYDMTFLCILLLSLSNEETSVSMEGCILNPMKKKPISRDHEALEVCAALSVIFSYHKLLDEIRDSKKVLAKAGSLMLKRAFKKAKIKHPEASQIIHNGLNELVLLEKGALESNSYIKAADTFGIILQELIELLSKDFFTDNKEQYIKAMGVIGMNMGRWVYLLDAVDDLDEDIKKEEPNPLKYYKKETANEKAKDMLVLYEQNCDKTAALLPYKRFAGIISNVFNLGMPQIRKKIFQGELLAKL